MGIIHRASEEWKELFKKRTTIERYFASAKHSRLLDRHQFLGPGEGESPRQNVDAGLPAHRMGSAEGGRLRTHKTHAHQVATALANRRTRRGAGVCGVLPLPAARKAKLKPKWNVHLRDIGNQTGRIGGDFQPLIAGRFGSGASPLLPGWPDRLGSQRPSSAPLTLLPGQRSPGTTRISGRRPADR